MKAKGSNISHHLFPDLTERLSANITKSEFGKAAANPVTTGAIHEPMNDGFAIEGGLCERMHQEEAETTRRNGATVALGV